MPIHLPTYLPTYLHTYIHTYIHTMNVHWFDKLNTNGGLSPINFTSTCFHKTEALYLHIT